MALPSGAIPSFDSSNFFTSTDIASSSLYQSGLVEPRDSPGAASERMKPLCSVQTPSGNISRRARPACISANRCPGGTGRLS